MKKLALFLAFALIFLAFAACTDPEQSYEADPGGMYVRFMTNVPEETVTLSNGNKAVADNTLFERVAVDKGKTITVPETSPSREGYVFSGWALDPDGEMLFDFSTPVYADMTLFAKWDRDEKPSEQTYVEPKLAFEEKVSGSASLNLTGVLNMPVENGSVTLTTAGLKILQSGAQNVKPYLNYTVNSTSTVTSATYANKVITINYTSGGQENSTSITVKDGTLNLKVDNQTYENKAVKYENNVTIAPYSVVLAGSSSMENWSTSKEDMAPVTTCNVGIGGTTVEQWKDKLAKRLIYPFNPRAVVFYVGINNIINSKMSGAATGQALNALFDDVHSHLPNAQIYFILLNKIPNYKSYFGEIDVANTYATNYAAQHKYVTLIDAGRLLVKESGVPNSAYFLSDGLHMSLCGYVLWGKEVKDTFIKTEKELYK